MNKQEHQQKLLQDHIKRLRSLLNKADSLIWDDYTMLMDTFEVIQHDAKAMASYYCVQAWDAEDDTDTKLP